MSTFPRLFPVPSSVPVAFARPPATTRKTLMKHPRGLFDAPLEGLYLAQPAQPGSGHLSTMSIYGRRLCTGKKIHPELCQRLCALCVLFLLYFVALRRRSRGAANARRKLLACSYVGVEAKPPQLTMNVNTHRDRPHDTVRLACACVRAISVHSSVIAG